MLTLAKLQHIDLPGRFLRNTIVPFWVRLLLRLRLGKPQKEELHSHLVSAKHEHNTA